MSQQNLEEEAGYGQTDCRKMKQQAMAKRPDCRINPRDFVVADAHTPRCGPLLLPHCTPVRPRVSPREMTMHLLPVSPGPNVLPIPTATAPPNLPQQRVLVVQHCSVQRTQSVNTGGAQTANKSTRYAWASRHRTAAHVRAPTPGRRQSPFQRCLLCRTRTWAIG